MNNELSTYIGIRLREWLAWKTTQNVTEKIHTTTHHSQNLYRMVAYTSLETICSLMRHTDWREIIQIYDFKIYTMKWMQVNTHASSPLSASSRTEYYDESSFIHKTNYYSQDWNYESNEYYRLFISRVYQENAITLRWQQECSGDPIGLAQGSLLSTIKTFLHCRSIVTVAF